MTPSWRAFFWKQECRAICEGWTEGSLYGFYLGVLSRRHAKVGHQGYCISRFWTVHQGPPQVQTLAPKSQTQPAETRRLPNMSAGVYLPERYSTIALAWPHISQWTDGEGHFYKISWQVYVWGLVKKNRSQQHAITLATTDQQLGMYLLTPAQSPIVKEALGKCFNIKSHCNHSGYIQLWTLHCWDLRCKGHTCLRTQQLLRSGLLFASWLIAQLRGLKAEVRVHVFAVKLQSFRAKFR